MYNPMCTDRKSISSRKLHPAREGGGCGGGETLRFPRGPLLPNPGAKYLCMCEWLSYFPLSDVFRRLGNVNKPAECTTFV